MAVGSVLSLVLLDSWLFPPRQRKPGKRDRSRKRRGCCSTVCCTRERSDVLGRRHRTAAARENVYAAGVSVDADSVARMETPGAVVTRARHTVFPSRGPRQRRGSVRRRRQRRQSRFPNLSGCPVGHSGWLSHDGAGQVCPTRRMSFTLTTPTRQQTRGNFGLIGPREAALARRFRRAAAAPARPVPTPD